MEVNMEVNTSIKNSTDNLSVGQHKIACPLCQDQRTKHRRDKPLSVNVETEKVVYHCHHCGENGIVPKTNGVKLNVVKEKPKPVKLKALPKNDINGASAKWLEERGICPDTAVDFGCTLAENKYKPVIGFSFTQGGKLEAVKYRSANGEKKFWWDGNAQRLWGNNTRNDKLEDVADTIVITEGEMDALAIKTAFKDYANIEVYSVPNGAPAKITDNKIDPSEDGRFKYVWEDRQKFENKNRIILATDKDTSGDVLADELSRRLNKARCYRVDYQGCKDANELLVDKGAEAVRNQVLNSEPIPLHGLNSIDHYADDFQNLYEKGMPSGVSTGYPSVDKLFTLATGNLFVVTGYPGDGKSAFIDQLIVNVARQSGWKTCFCSFEKPPQLHAVQLSQVLTGKPFFQGLNPRMTQEEKDFAETWIKDHILFQDYMDGDMPTIEAILEKGASAVMRYGVRILVIDPYNFIHNDRHTGLETDMVSDMLTKVQLFAKQHGVLVFFVAHPTKPQVRDGKKNVCTGVDIAKSMAWFSKADTGLTVYRSDEGVEIHNWKARWGWQGSLGSVNMEFNPVNGRYKEREQIEDNFDWEF
jgi:twinkle protein